MALLLASIGFGLVTASILAIASVGVTVQFGVTNYINFAYGDLLTLGAYFAWLLQNLHVPFLLAAALSIGTLGLLAVALNRLVLQPFVRRGVPLLFLLIVTFGLSLIISNIVLLVWGSDFQSFQLPSENPLRFGPMSFTAGQLGIIVVAILSMVAIHLLLRRTEVGRAMRAMSDDRELAQISGINIKRITDITWFISGCLAGLGGIVLAVNVTDFDPTFGENFLFLIFSAVILGGIGQPYGAMLGALVIGLATEVSVDWVGAGYKGAVAFAILILMLLLRPQGIIPSRGRGTTAWRMS